LKGWLELQRGDTPLIVTFPHTGTDFPPNLETRLVSPWLARKDTDWWVHRLYDMAQELRATSIRTRISRSVIDVNRDPSGVSLYPGQATTELCPLTTFDGEPLYWESAEPIAEEIAERRGSYFAPYHETVRSELERLRAIHERVVLYDAHSIRSRVPRLFQGELPHLNIGTNRGASCDAELTRAVERACAQSSFSRVTDGRFVGGWTTRHYGRPKAGIHAIQMELACRGYLDEPPVASEDNWPPEYAPARAQPLREVLQRVLQACIDVAQSQRRN
jgi:N-formylglutamate deformylase